MVEDEPVKRAPDPTVVMALALDAAHRRWCAGPLSAGGKLDVATHSVIP